MSLLHQARDDRAQVDVWRAEQLLKAGYPQKLAIQIGEDDRIDLHLAIRMIQQGCSPRDGGSDPALNEEVTMGELIDLTARRLRKKGYVALDIPGPTQLACFGACPSCGEQIVGVAMYSIQLRLPVCQACGESEKSSA